MAEILFIVYASLLGIGIFISVVRYGNTMPSYIAILLLTFVLTFIVEIFARYVVTRPNHWLYNLYLPIEYLLFSALYYVTFPLKYIRRIIIFCSSFLIVFVIINITCLQKINEFNTYTLLISGSLILTWVFLYFKLLLQKKEYINLLREPMFWISTGLLFFYAGNVFVAGTLNYFIKADLTIAKLMLQMIKLLNILMFSLFIVAILCQPRRKSL